MHNVSVTRDGNRWRLDLPTVSGFTYAERLSTVGATARNYIAAALDVPAASVNLGDVTIVTAEDHLDENRGVHLGLGPHPAAQAAVRLVPKLGPVVASWRQDSFDRNQRRAQKLGEAVSETIDIEEFFNHVATNERLSDLFDAAVAAAMATSSDAKVRLLGRALAASATAEDDAAVDEVEQLMRIAVDLEPVDLRALRALDRWHTPDAIDKVGYALRVTEATAGPIVARLERLHLIKVERTATVLNEPDTDEVAIDEAWGLTAAARALLTLLRERVHPREAATVREDGLPWAGFTDAQAQALEQLAESSHHDWRRQPRADEQVARTLRQLDAQGLTYGDIRTAMRSVGFSEVRLKELDRWSSTTR